MNKRRKRIRGDEKKREKRIRGEGTVLSTDDRPTG